MKCTDACKLAECNNVEDHNLIDFDEEHDENDDEFDDLDSSDEDE